MTDEKENARAAEDGAGREESQASSEHRTHEGNHAAVPVKSTPLFDDAETMAAVGYELIPLGVRKKTPRDKGWTQRRYDSLEVIREAQRSGGNIGVRLRPSDLVVDVDPRNGGDESLRQLVADTGLDLSACPHVVTGGGGHHYYLRKPPEVVTVGGLAKKYPGIDFKKVGGHVVAPGSIHPETGRLYESEFFLVQPGETPNASEALIEILRVRRLECVEEGVDAHRWGEISPLQLAEAIAVMPSEDFSDQDEWFQLMCACHHATAGAGREEFIAWSTQDPKYSDHSDIIGQRWDSLSSKGSGRPMTIRYLYKVLAGYGTSVPHPAPEEDFEAVTPEPSSEVPDTVQPLAKEWVWVADAYEFIRRKDLKRYPPDQWRTLYQHLMETPILNAVWKSSNFIQKFEAMTYRPKAPEVIVGGRGKVYNIWRPSALQPVPGEVSWFLDHMEYLIPDASEREAALDYLAHLVQRPDVKIHFALVIRGEQGTGKSAIGELMLRIIGKANVTKPSNDEVTSRWTSWQEGAQLAILEELMTVGRLEVANRLKPLITEPTLRVEQKHKPVYSIENHLNLLCFTNHKDAVKIERGDRRWFIVFSPAKSRDRAYYQRLFDKISGDGAAHVAHWLTVRDLSRFNAKGHAPATAAKDQMRELSVSEAEAMLMELHEDQDRPFEFDLLALEDVINILPPRVQRATRNLSAVCTKFLEDGIGAVQHKRNTNTRGSAGAVPNLRLWSIRDHEKWSKAGPTERAIAHDNYRRQKAKQYESDFQASLHEEIGGES